MEIKKAATAGTLESSDCMVTVEPGEGKIDFSLESSVIHQYGNQLRKVALETLKDLDIDNVRITIVDKGALDCTLRPASRARCSALLTSMRICLGEVLFDEQSEQEAPAPHNDVPECAEARPHQRPLHL